MFKAVFFDLDHTLWDFERNAEASLKHLHEIHNLDQHMVNADDFVTEYSRINHAMWKQYDNGEIDKEFLRTQRFIRTFKHFGIPEENIPANLWDQYLELLPLRTHVMEGCFEILDYLKPKYPLTIITNGFKEVQHLKMQNSRLSPYFNHVVISEFVGYQKPAREIFDHALELNQCHAREVIMIGDNPEADIQGAKNAGIKSVFYNPSGQDDPVGADYVITQLLDLKTIL